MECEICHRGPSHGTTVYRASPKGIAPARWRCAAHPCAESLAEMRAVGAVVAVLENQRRQ